MTENEKTNLVAKLSSHILRFINKERRENVIVPTGEEYMDCLEMALDEIEKGVLQPRKPGRPPKKPTIEVMTLAVIN